MNTLSSININPKIKEKILKEDTPTDYNTAITSKGFTDINYDIDKTVDIHFDKQVTKLINDINQIQTEINGMIKNVNNFSTGPNIQKLINTATEKRKKLEMIEKTFKNNEEIKNKISSAINNFNVNIKQKKQEFDKQRYEFLSSKSKPLRAGRINKKSKRINTNKRKSKKNTKK